MKQLRAKKGVQKKSNKGKGPSQCITFQKTGACSFGDKCRYLHTVSEAVNDGDVTKGGDEMVDVEQHVDLHDWLMPHNSSTTAGMGFLYEDVVPSPAVDGYRNKCEFTVGRNIAGEIAVGFRVGTYLEGSISVDSPRDAPNIAQVYVLDIF